MIRKRLMAIAMIAALFGSLGFGLQARAATSGTVTIDASVADVLTLTVDPGSFTFGSDLNFLGANAAQGSCAFSTGARYFSPNVTTTVQSNRAYDLTRAGSGSFPVGRIGVREHAPITTCADLTTMPIPLTAGPNTIVAAHPATANGQDTEFFVFDVLVDSPAAATAPRLHTQSLPSKTRLQLP